MAMRRAAGKGDNIELYLICSCQWEWCHAFWMQNLRYQPCVVLTNRVNPADLRLFATQIDFYCVYNGILMSQKIINIANISQRDALPVLPCAGRAVRDSAGYACAPSAGFANFSRSLQFPLRILHAQRNFRQGSRVSAALFLLSFEEILHHADICRARVTKPPDRRRTVTAQAHREFNRAARQN
jgi:hypothetical protein